MANRSLASIEQRRAYARERSRTRYAKEKDKVLSEINKYKQGDTYKNGTGRRRKYQKEYMSMNYMLGWMTIKFLSDVKAVVIISILLPWSFIM